MPKDLRQESRVPYETTIEFVESDGREIPRRRRTGVGLNLSITGLCFVAAKRPKSDSLVVFLPSATARVDVIDVRPFDDAQYSIRCRFVEWLNV